MRRLLVLIAILGASGTASAGHICELAEEGVLEVDASLDEWRDFKALSRGRGDADASFEMRCGYDKHRLYVAVRVRDERIIRTGKGESGSDDNLMISLGAGGESKRTVRVFPGTRGFKPKRVAGGKIKVEDTLLEDGWAVEVSVPLSSIPGWGPSTPLLQGEVTYRDVDKAGAGPEARLPFTGSMHFSGSVPALRGFLSTARLAVKDLRLDTLANVDGLPGTERVVSGGKFLGILTDEFAFIELPVESPADILDVQLVDLDGDRRSSLLAHYRQHGGGGSRELVTVWNLNAQNQLAMSFGFEVAVEQGERRLTNRWSLVPAGVRRAPDKGKRPKKGKRVPGTDLLVEVAPDDNKGWSPKSFAQIIPATDVRPIMTPWQSGRRAVVYYFDGETALEAAALPAAE
jgi:hypothetical protein